MRHLFLALPLLFLAACAEAPADAPPPDAADLPAEAPALEADAAPVATARHNLNTASQEAFMTIPGVGERMAHEFEEYRPYASVLQFRREIGKYVDDEQVAAYEPYVYVPVDPDASDAATLMQLPGVDEAVAERLIAGRPYGSADAFLTAYEAAAPDGDRDAAAALLAE